MDLLTAVRNLRAVIGQDLRELADRYGVTVWAGDRKNKGWAGQVIECCLGLPINSTQAPNGGLWELKIVPLKRNRKGQLQVKETMAITMINPDQVANTPFERSHLLAKLKTTLICARIFESQAETRSLLYMVGTFNLDDRDLFAQVRADYELIRRTIQTRGFEALTGAMGVLVQPRTKGPGYGSISRAFYARTAFVARILGLEP